MPRARSQDVDGPLEVAARATGAAAVVVFSELPRSRPQAVASLRAVDAVGMPVFFSGKAFDSPESRELVPGTYLGVRPASACLLLIGALGST
ncbi:MAG: hypothetical protein M3Y77_20365 [Actinomycetota bacterium]|nr:hypothetical protein [Actinomycetota bacterium]